MKSPRRQRRSRRLAAALLAGGGAAFGCGGQRGPEKTVEKTVGDRRPPRLILAPEVRSVGADSAELVFAVDERADGAFVVRDAGQLHLSQDDIEASADRVAAPAAAFATVRLPLAQLAPGRRYEVHLTLRDDAGNALEAPVVVPFETHAATVAGTLEGTPPRALQGVPWRFAPSGLPSGCRLSLLAAPRWIALDEAGLAVVGIPEWRASEPRVGLSLGITGPACEGRADFTIETAGDPLYEYAWHLRGDATPAFSWFQGPRAAGIDLTPALAEGLTGRGVRVTLVDSGLQAAHPDLRGRVDVGRSVNLDALGAGDCQVCEPHDTTPPLTPGAPGDQGTAVAGIIAAEGWNGEGSRGVAPGARLDAYNLSARRLTHVTANDYLRIFSLDTDVVCDSAAVDKALLRTAPTFSFYDYDSAQKAKVTLGRAGKGIVYVKAAGDLGAEGGNTFYDQRGQTSWGITVGSHDSVGRRSRHASQGASLWLSAPGGEAGWQSEYDAAPAGLPADDFLPGIVTTDLFDEDEACAVGYAKRPQLFDPQVDAPLAAFNLGHSSGFNLGWHALNKACRYTAFVPNTAAAAGIVAGAVALLLEAQPGLTWRDVKYVLARSAQPIDAAHSGEVTTIGGSLYETVQPWITNAAGYRFHNWYGFGALDVGAALKLARSPTRPTLPPLVDTDWILAGGGSQRIPPASIAGASADYFSVNDLLLESVQVRLSVTHPDVGRLGVELVAPSGTKSILKAVNDGGEYADVRNMVFLSNAFYGERSRGLWRLRVVDGGRGGPAGNLGQWSMRLTGHRQVEE